METKTNISPYERNNWITGLHLIQLCNLFVPLSGLIGAVSIWQLKREEIEEVNLHGKKILNFQLSMAVISLLSGIAISTLFLNPTTMAYDLNGVQLLHTAASLSYFLSAFLYGVLVGFPLYSVSQIKKGMQPFYPSLYQFLR